MDDILYDSFGSYFNALEKLGYMSADNSNRLLLLSFYRDFVFGDYRGLLSREDYYTIEKALDCLYGSTCLIPYPDYLKMGKLHLGQVTEIGARMKSIEDTNVLKVIHDMDGVEDSGSDIMVVETSE